MSDSAVFGSMFQKKYGGAAVDLAYAQAQALQEAAKTYKKMLAEGRKEAAEDYKNNVLDVAVAPGAAEKFTQRMGQISKMEHHLRQTVKDPEELRTRIDKLDAMRNDLATKYVQMVSKLTTS